MLILIKNGITFKQNDKIPESIQLARIYTVKARQKKIKCGNVRQFQQGRPPALQGAGGCGGLHHQFSVLLHHSVEVRDSMVDLMDAFHLLAGGDGNFTHDTRDAADAGADLIHAFPGQMYIAGAGCHAVGGGVDKRFDPSPPGAAARRYVLRLPPRQTRGPAHRRAPLPPRRSAPDIGLEGDAINHAGDIANFAEATSMDCMVLMA